jgi:hypothetical protein
LFIVPIEPTGIGQVAIYREQYRNGSTEVLTKAECKSADFGNSETAGAVGVNLMMPGADEGKRGAGAVPRGLSADNFKHSCSLGF